MSAHRSASSHQAVVSARLEQLERDMNNQTVRKSKSGRWKTQKGRRGTIIRNWVMDSATGGVVSSNASPTVPDGFQQFYQSYDDRPKASHQQASVQNPRPPSHQRFPNQYFYQPPPTQPAQQQPKRTQVSSGYSYYANAYDQRVVETGDKKKQDALPSQAQFVSRAAFPFRWQGAGPETRQLPNSNGPGRANEAQLASNPKLQGRVGTTQSRPNACQNSEPKPVASAAPVFKAVPVMVSEGGGGDAVRATEKLFDFLEEYDASPAPARKPPPPIRADRFEDEDSESTTTRL